MSKYSKKIIFDYIIGNDIEEYDIEELEDDYEFMIKVIEHTSDKKMYSMCSDKVKNTYEFIKFIVLKFNRDIDFICNVADEYFNNTENEFNYLELLIIMCNLVDKDDNRYIKYKILLEAKYSAEKVKIDLISIHPDMKDTLEIMRGVFWFIFDKYNSSDIIMKYFAKKFVDEYMIKLEERVHNDFDSLNELEETGINNYLINLLFGYDSNLSAYISCHLELLDDLKKCIKSIKIRWNFYNSQAESEKYNAIIDAVSNYFEDYADDVDLIVGETEILYYIGKELGINEKIFKYDCISKELYEEIMNYISNKENFIDRAKKNNNLKELYHYQTLKKIILSILKGTNSKQQSENKLKKRYKVISFNSRKTDT